MANENDVSVSLGLQFDGSSIQKTIDTMLGKVNASVNKSTSKIGDDISKNTKKGVDSAVKELSKLDQEIDKIMKDQSKIDKFGLGTDKLQKSRAGSIAALLKKEQGLGDSEAFKKAYDIVGRKAKEAGEIVAKSTDKAQKKTNKFFDLFKKKANSAKKQASDVGNNLNVGIGGALKKLAALGASAFAVGKIVQFGKECVELGSNLAEVQNVVDVTFGSMSSRVDEWAKSSIKSMGLSELSAKKYTSTMGAMLKSMGFTGDAVYDMSTSLTQLAGDMNSFYNIEDAFDKIRSGISGETEPLKQLGINLSVANLEAYALTKGITKSYNSMTQMEQAQLRYNYLLKVTADAQGDFARNQNSWANQTRILSENFNALKSSIGQGLINVLLPVVKVLNTLMEKLVVVGNLFSKFTSKIFGKAEVTTTSFASNMDSGLSGVVDSAGAASDAIGEVADAAKKASKQALGFDELNVLSKPEESSSSGAGVGDVGSVGGGGLTEITEQTEDLTNKETILDKVLNKLKNIDFTNLKNSFANLKESIAPIIDLIGDGLKWVYDNVLVPFGKWTIEEALPAAIDTLSGAFELIGKVAENVGPKLANIWDKFLSPIMGFVADAIVEGLKNLADGLSDIANNETAVDILGDLVLALGGIMVASKVIGIITGIANALTILGGSLKALAGGELLKATSIFGKLANVFSLVAGGAGTLHEAMMLVFGKVGTVLAGIGAIIGGAIIAVKNFFGMWEKGWNLLNSILMAIGIAIAAVGAIILGAPALVTGVIAAIIAVVANLVIVIKDNWESIKAVTFAVFKAIGEFFVNLWNGIVEVVKAMISAFVATVKRNWEAIKSFTSFIFESIANFFVNVWTNIKNFFTVTIPSIVNFVITKWTEFKEKISTILTIIKDFLINAWTNIKEKITTAISNIVEFGKEKFESFKNGVVNIFTTIGNTIKNVFSTIVNFVGDKISSFKENVINGFNIIKDGAINIFNGMKDTISNVFSGLVNIIKTPMNSIISIINKAIDGINGMSIDVPDWVPLIGGEVYSFNLPKIPELASGGLVTQPTLAMVGEGREDEIVSPISTLRAIENEGNAETNALLRQLISINLQILNKNQDISLDIDGYQMATVLTNIQNNENRRRGW